MERAVALGPLRVKEDRVARAVLGMFLLPLYQMVWAQVTEGADLHGVAELETRKQQGFRSTTSPAASLQQRDGTSSYGSSNSRYGGSSPY